jgi:hypothetical protein
MEGPMGTGNDGYHFSFSLGKSMFSELLSAALPVSVKKGEFELRETTRQVWQQLQLREKVSGLIEQRDSSGAIVRAKDKAVSIWDGRRDQIYTMFHEMVKVEGDWEVELDNDGSGFHYGDQTIGAEATFKLSAKGTARLFKENVELPFDLSKRLGAEVHLRDIKYDQQTGRIVGYLRGLSLKLGDHPIWRLVEDATGKLIDTQAERFNPVPILKSDQIESLLQPAMGALKVDMGIEDIALDVDDDQMSLKVKFGFSQRQIAG